MIHAKDDGNTLLHFASRAGNILLIRKLLQQGEDINAKNAARLWWSYHGTARSGKRCTIGSQELDGLQQKKHWRFRSFSESRRNRKIRCHALG
jgi:ankyrin repeat protein